MSKTTLDLSTLSDISGGTHSITVKAAAEGYIDSEFSNEVEWTKTPSSYSGRITTTRFNLHIYGIDDNEGETLVADDIQDVTVSGYIKYRVNIGNTSTVYNYTVNNTNCTYSYQKVTSGDKYGQNWTITASGEFAFNIIVS